MKHLAIALALVAVVAACSKKPGSSSQDKTTAAVPPASAQVPGQTPSPGQEAVKPVPAQLPDVLARVNGKEVSRTEFEDAIRNVEAQNGPVPADRRDAFYRALLDDLVGYHLLQQDAGARKVQIDEKGLEARIEQIRTQAGDEATFQKLLSDRKTSLEGLRDNLRRQMLVDRLIETVINPTVLVPAGAVTDFYNQNPDKFVQPETIRASHILVRVPQNPDEAARTKARGEADALLAKLKGGADFAKVAKESSQDPGSAANGGEIPPFARGQMIPQFEQAAFDLQPGQMSAVVETSFGFHIIKVHERKAPVLVPIEQVRPQIQDFLANQQRQEKVSALIAELKAKGKVEILI